MRCLGRTKGSSFTKRCSAPASFLLFCQKHVWQPLVVLSVLIGFGAAVAEFTGCNLKDVWSYVPRSANPDLVVTLDEISFVGEDSTGRSGEPVPRIVFKMGIRNRGRRDATLWACWLVLDGKTRSEAESLVVTPPKLTIKAESAVDGVEAALLTERVRDFRDLSATLILRDAADREYPQSKIIVRPASFGTPIESLPVQKD
jgi:hypothetical protein